MRPASYLDKYTQPPDLLAGHYEEYFAPFAGDALMGPVALKDRVVAAAHDVPKYFMCLRANGPHCVVDFLHAPERYSPSMTGATVYDDRLYAKMGDAVGTTIGTVEYPAAPFQISILARVKTNDSMVATLDAHNDATLLGPYDANEPNTVMLNGRATCPFPTKHIAHVHGQTFHPATLYRWALTQFTADGDLVALRVVLDWLRLACTNSDYYNALGLPRPILDFDLTLTSPVMSERYLKWVATLVTRDLEFAPTASAFEQRIVEVNERIAISQEAALQATNARHVEKNRDKTVSEALPHLYSAIHRQCDASCDAELSPLIQESVNLSKDERGPYYANTVRLRAKESDSAGPHVPILGPNTVLDLTHHRMTPTDDDDIESGLASPYCVQSCMSRTGKQAAKNQEMLNLVHSGHVAPNLAECRTLTKSAPDLPQTMSALTMLLICHSILLDCYLNKMHRLCIAYRQFIMKFRECSYKAEKAYEGRQHLFAPLVAYEICLMMREFFQDVEIRGTSAPLPDFQQVNANIKQGRWYTFTSLPLQYASPIRTPLPGLGANEPRGDGRPAPQPTTGIDRSPATNNTPDMTLMARYTSAGSPGMNTLTTAAHRARAPLNQDGQRDGRTTALCLTWTLKAQCIKGCDRNTAHRVLTSTETARVNAFLDVCFA
jgi:hypothetical protein